MNAESSFHLQSTPAPRRIPSAPSIDSARRIPTAPRIPSALVLALLTPLLLCSCSRWPVKMQPMSISPAAAAMPGVADLRGGRFDAAALSAAFPALRSYSVTAEALASRRILFKTYRQGLTLSMAAQDAETLRLAGRHPGDSTTLFDLFSDGKMMCAYAPLAKALFKGDIPPGGSPFKDAIGVEPSALIPVFAIGSRLAAMRAACEGDDAASAALLGYSEGPLRRVEFQAGLPRRVWFAEGKSEWTVDYLAWDAVEPKQGGGGAWLLPTRMKITNHKPRVAVEVTVRQYNALNPPPAAKRFTCPEAAGAKEYPLEDLKQVLGF